MKAIESIQKLLNYIENNISQEISMDKLAGECFLSKFYMHKLFRECTGYSVEEYIRLRRLARSVEELQNGVLVKDAAEKTGFKNVEHYSRAFKKAYGISPKEYKDVKPPMYHAYKPDVLLKNAELELGEVYVSDGIVLNIRVKEIEEVEVVGVDVECSMGIESVGFDSPAVAWNTFHREKEKIKNRAEPYEEFGISYNCSENGFNYMAASKVSDVENIPDGMKSYSVPGGKYLCCIYESESFEEAVGGNMQNAMGFFFGWTEKMGYEMKDGTAVEYYSQVSIEEAFRVEIWTRI